MAAINADLHQRFRNVPRLPSIQIENGTEDIRLDEEQTVKFQEIVDLLVAAGYFRARIKGLSSFDKIVGGMTWCIESCSINIDVDLLFQENLTIGQKIPLTEKIVAVLPKMKCPHRIEPHQIQGLDCIHIFPIIQWLVKRSMEVRQEMSASVHSYAVNQFNKEFPLENKNVDAQKQVLSNVNTVREVYRPRRFFRRKNAPPTDIQSKVQITLLEYGMQGLKFSNKSTESDSLDDTFSEDDIQQLMNDMTIMNEDGADSIELNEEERLEVLKHYSNLQSEMEDGGLQSKEEKKFWALEQQKQILIERCSRLEEKLNLIENSLLEETKSVENIKLQQEEKEKELKILESKESKYDKNFKEIEELVKVIDDLKSQEVQFKEQRRQEMTRLQQLIDEKENQKPTEENKEQFGQEINDETEKLRLVRLQLAKRNRAIAIIQRKLDEIPTQAELSQYQRRFLELYNQVASKHKETKQYFTLYNTLNDTRTYIKKELSLLNSICDSYPEALTSNSNKEDFLKQFEVIVDGVKQSKRKVESKLVEERHKRDQLSLQLQGLVEQQRRYATAIKQLSIECRKQEVLLSQQNT